MPFLFFQHFFHVLSCMKRPQGRGLESARKHIASCLTELESILKSADFLRSCFDESCEGDIDDKTTASGCEPIGFDAMLNSRLSAPTPPRAIKILSWKKVRIFCSLILISLSLLSLLYNLSYFFGRRLNIL